MTIGIYKLNFNNTNKVYIGQSLNIEKRWISHQSNLRLGKSPTKLQEAHDTYGLISYDIITECIEEDLNDLEEGAIDVYDSFLNGFNSTNSATGPALRGEDNTSAVESNNTYRKVLALLVQDNPTLTKRQISSICNTSIYVVRHIAALETHTWLKEDMPEEYSKLEQLKNTPYTRGIQHPKLISPSGEIHDVIHMTNFAKLHGLLQPKVCEVLKGTRKHTKGWRLYIPN